MSTPHPVPLPITASEVAERVAAARARAEGYVWGVLHIDHPDTADARTATAFADAYATGVGTLLAEGTQPPTLGRAWVSWRADGDITAELTTAAHDQTPTFEQYDPALHDSSTRYCNQCLAGDGSAVQDAHGGAWKRAWRLPITFACLTHRRLLAHRCGQCGHRIHNRAGSVGSHGLITHSRIGGLHPAQCRSPLAAVKPEEGKRAVRPACGLRLDRVHDAPLVDAPTLRRLLAVQRDLTILLEGRSSTAISCGLQAPAPNYFVDLRVVTELLSSSWPAARAFAPSAAIATAVDRTVEMRQPEISTQRNGRTKTHRAAPHRRPPLPADECGALLATTTQILGALKSPADAAELLAELLEHDRTRQPTSSIGLTDRVLQRAQNDCSRGLRTAIGIITQKMS